MSEDNGENDPNGDIVGADGGAGDPAFERMMNEAIEHHRNSRFQQAAECYWKVIEADPDHPQATYYLGMVMHRIGENEKAVELVSRGIALGFVSAEGYCNLGIIYNHLKQLEKVIECQKQSIALDSQYTAAYFNLGNAYRDLGQPEAAIEALEIVVTQKPDFYQAYNNLGLALYDARRFEEALGCYDKALTSKPGYADAYLNIGNAQRELGRPDAAAVSFQKAVVLERDFFEAHNNLGNVLMEMKQLEAASASYANAIDLEPENPGAHKNLGIISLLRGDFETGWPEYSWRRLEDNPVFRARNYKPPFWDGGDLTGKTIFIYPEQGFGDTIQFVRFLPMLRQRGARVAFDVPLPMVRLFKDLDGIDVALKDGDTLPPFDCHIPLLELPGLFETTLDTIPWSGPYLHADKDLVDAWSVRLGPKQGFRIGLVWGGSPGHLNDFNRSINPELLRPLAEMPNVSAYSFMIGHKDETARVFGDAVTDLAPALTDFAETAAAIANMDLVISVDTAIVHAAGALGAPVWTLLPFNPDWRWMLDRDDSPWYPSMRLFRQVKRKDWENVMERAAVELADLVKAGSGAR